MIVLIPPSKTFSSNTSKGITNPIFINKANDLKTELKRFTLNDFKTKFKLSNNLSEEVYSYYHNDNISVSAINLYEGVLYKALKNVELNYNSNNKLYIISALYGILRPFDKISKYRLDFNIKTLGNLYLYWKSDITKYLESNYETEIIINLTSLEFYPLLSDLTNLVNIEFRGVSKRLSSVLLKQLRGYMANSIINNNVKTINELKEVNIKGFKYSNELSNEKTLVFIEKKAENYN